MLELQQHQLLVQAFNVKPHTIVYHSVATDVPMLSRTFSLKQIQLIQFIKYTIMKFMMSIWKWHHSNVYNI